MEPSDQAHRVTVPHSRSITSRAAHADRSVADDVTPAVRHLQRAKDLVDRCYAESMGVADMAAEAGLSQAHFSREFTRVFDEPPYR